MAEAFLKHLGGDRFHVESAGLEPGELNPLVVEVMGEIGIDISKNPTNSVFDFFKEGKLFTYVITVCDQEAAERCPIFPGMSKHLHWSFNDPSCFEGTHKEKLVQVRVVRDQIRSRIRRWLEEGF
jgi:arsenate reductase